MLPPHGAGQPCRRAYLATAVPSRRSACLAGVDGMRQPHREQGRRLRLERQVGEHVAPSAVGRSSVCRRRCGGSRGASPGRLPAACPEAEPTTQSSRVALTIWAIVATPRPSGPTIQPRVPSNSTSLEALERLPSLSLSRWRRKGLRVPSGSTRGTSEARQAARRLGEHEEQVAHRRGAEPLVTGQDVGAVEVRAQRAGGPGAYIRTALLLGHRHSGQRRRLARDAVRCRTHAPSAAESTRRRGRGRRLPPQRRYGRVSHGDGAAVARIDLATRRRSPRRGSRERPALVSPGGGVQPVLDGCAQQLVVAGVVVDLVDPVAVAVVGMQHRRVAVGFVAPALRLGASGEPTERAELVRCALPAPYRSTASCNVASAVKTS